jgi:hypothetical protein
MRFCDSSPSTLAEWNILYSTTISLYDQASQFNYAIPLPSLFNTSHPLFVLVNQTLAANSIGEVLRIPLQMQSLRSPGECLPWSDTLSARDLSSVGIEAKSWTYVQCVSVPADTIAIGQGTIFPPSNVGIDQVASCQRLGVSSDFAQLSNDEIIKRYKLTKDDLLATKRILFTQGGFDPTSSVGPPELDTSSNSDPDATRTALMPGIGHTEEMFSSSFDNNPSVSDVRYSVSTLPRANATTLL